MPTQRPSKIYDLILQSVKDIESELQSVSSDAKLDNAKQQALDIIKNFRIIKIDPSIEELNQNQEWDIYTIAFYGETNAGKSTVIESLRIYFQEKTKLETQNKFNEILNKYENKVKEIEQDLFNTIFGIDQSKIKYDTITAKFETIKKEIETKILNLKNLDIEKKEKSHWYRFISFLNFNSIKKDIVDLERLLNKEETRVKDELKKINDEKEFGEKNLANFENFLQKLHAENLPILHDLSDGQIIGDGRSDFTQQTTHYLFTHNEQKFAFLDVPGIEGKESVVIDEISSAVKKAHAVFYVTSNPTPPQKGDVGKKGTLEKIKEHLGSQTEVYAIFNKRITNPMQLEKLLINEDEYLSLEVLDTKLKEIIGENYIGHKKLSAKVSFLALAECLAPTLKTREEKNKFLNKFTKDDLLEKALLTDFTDFITNDLIQNTKAKIKKSNFNKANEVLKELIALLASVSKKNLEPLYKQLSKELQDVTYNLNNTVQATKNRMNSEVEKATRNFENKTRKIIYSDIDTNISDDSFKNKLELTIKIQYEQVQKDLPEMIEKEFQKFQDEINEVMENFNRRVNNTIKEFRSISFDTNNSNIDINIGNGIDGVGLMGSLAGAGGLAYSAMMFGNGWNPIGWTMFAIGVVTVLIGFGKSIHKFFSDDYKKSEQKKSADENIARIGKDIKTSISEKLMLSFKDFDKLIDKIRGDLESDVEQVKKVNDYIIDSNVKLMQLSRNIQTEGQKQ
ncbi:MAG: hypothetical protein PHQ22_01715 [Sulfuricurvum sp.]|nr:hypothetical protein [Sulfuricurvum sp.]MDD5385893.1 hypothetical protein [Sulfuricurvum sp.]